jgi:hypothetical protein
MGEQRRVPRLAAVPAVWPATALAVLLLLGVAVVSSLAGPAEFGEPRFTPFTGLLDAPEPGVTDPAAPAEDTRPEPEGLPGWTWVVWWLLVVALTVLLVRSVYSWLAAGSAESAADDAGDGGADQGTLLAAVRRGVADAGAELGVVLPGRADDAVIRCWLALEDAASRAGTRRRRAQTPTEFTTALLQSQAADHEATQQLLALYHRARYGNSPLPADAVHQARNALQRIAASLENAPQPRRRRNRAGGDRAGHRG